MASSVDLFSLYANWYGSSADGLASFMCLMINLSRHLAGTEVSATGL